MFCLLPRLALKIRGTFFFHTYVCHACELYLFTLMIGPFQVNFGLTNEFFNSVTRALRVKVDILEVMLMK